jgi:thiamine pyrophosphate-dependent acetolactate synthase large subunit-like protein
VPDDHPYAYLTMRNDAFCEADLIVILGTRTNYVIGHALPPRFSAAAKVARIDIDIPEEMGNLARNIDIPIVGDCKSVLQQLCEAVDARTADRIQGWRQKLADGEAKKRMRAGGNYPPTATSPVTRICNRGSTPRLQHSIRSGTGRH